MKRFKLGMFFFILLMFFVFSCGVYAQENIDEENLTSQELALRCLSNSEDTLNLLIKDGFSFQRVNDTFVNADALYNNIFKQRKKDYSLVIESCDEIENIRILAYGARDGFLVLKKFYNESGISSLNTSIVDSLIVSIEEEISSERYEKVDSLIDEAYGEIISLQSANTALQLFYDATATGVRVFFVRNWKFLLGIFLTIVVVLFIYRVKIAVWRIERKISKLDIRRKTLKDLIKKTQKLYFDIGSLSESMYNIRIKKFAELVRDIDRQIPLLKEELAKLGKIPDSSALGKKNNGKKKK